MEPKWEAIKPYLVRSWALFEAAVLQAHKANPSSPIGVFSIEILKLLNEPPVSSRFYNWIEVFRRDLDVPLEKIRWLEGILKTHRQQGKRSRIDITVESLMASARRVQTEVMALHRKNPKENPLPSHPEFRSLVAKNLRMAPTTFNGKINALARGNDLSGWKKILKSFPVPRGMKPVSQETYERALAVFEKADGKRTEGGETGYSLVLEGVQKELYPRSSLKLFLRILKDSGKDIAPILKILERWRVPEHFYQ